MLNKKHCDFEFSLSSSRPKLNLIDLEKASKKIKADSDALALLSFLFNDAFNKLSDSSLCEMLNRSCKSIIPPHSGPAAQGLLKFCVVFIIGASCLLNFIIMLISLVVGRPLVWRGDATLYCIFVMSNK